MWGFHTLSRSDGVVSQARCEMTGRQARERGEDAGLGGRMQTNEEEKDESQRRETIFTPCHVWWIWVRRQRMAKEECGGGEWRVGEKVSSRAVSVWGGGAEGRNFGTVSTRRRRRRRGEEVGWDWRQVCDRVSAEQWWAGVRRRRREEGGGAVTDSVGPTGRWTHTDSVRTTPPSLRPPRYNCNGHRCVLSSFLVVTPQLPIRCLDSLTPRQHGELQDSTVMF